MAINSCNGADMAGFTRELIATAPGMDLHLMVRPDVDLDDAFTAFCTDEMEMIRVHGWLFQFEEVM